MSQSERATGRAGPPFTDRLAPGSFRRSAGDVASELGGRRRAVAANLVLARFVAVVQPGDRRCGNEQASIDLPARIAVA